MLLIAAVGSPTEAFESWRELLRKHDEISLAEQYFSVVPALYRNLAPAGCDPSQLTRFKGVYRHTWSRNQVIVGRLSIDIAKLRGAGIDARVSGDTSLAICYYKDTGARAIYRNQVEVANLEEALAILVSSGWRSKGPADGRSTKIYRDLDDETGASMTLVRPAREGGLPSDPPASVYLNGLKAPALGTSEQLLSTCLRGNDGGFPSLLQSAVDCSAILKTAANTPDRPWLESRGKAEGCAEKLELLIESVQSLLAAPREAPINEKKTGRTGYRILN